MKLFQELSNTLKRPRRLLKIFDKPTWVRYLKLKRLESHTSENWRNDSRAGGLEARPFDSYEDYLELQKSKLEYLDLSNQEVRHRRVLKERLGALDCIDGNQRVLCLAARLGGEVWAFRDLGCFAVGIDLNPGQGNSCVHYADFHDLPYSENCVDIVFTNSLDHAFDLGRVMKEVKRVLKADGRFILEADPGGGDAAADLWQSIRWERTEDLARLICEQGLKVEASSRFDYPRGGVQFIFSLEG